MVQKLDATTYSEPLIKVFHIGGRGNGFGPAEVLLQIKNSLELTIFEADIEGTSWEEYDAFIKDFTEKYGVKLSLMPYCLSNTLGKKQFHINVIPDCSSLLEMSPSARNFQRKHSFEGKIGRIVWGDVCAPVKTAEIDVVSLDHLYHTGVISLPDFLSIDAQGVEYEIMEGASKAFQGDLLGVVSEVEFSELYEGQKLFMDQYDFLKKRQFRLIDLINTEYWYTGTIAGKGSLTVGEALFFRDYRYFVEKYREPTQLLPPLIKLAITAYCFERTSYAYEIIDFLMKNQRPHWDAYLANNTGGYLHLLSNFYQQQSQVQELPTYSDFSQQQSQVEKPPAHSEPVEQESNTSIPPKKQALKSVLNLIYDFNLKMVVQKLKHLK